MGERQVSAFDSWVRWILDGCPEDRIPYVLRYFGPHKRRLENLFQEYSVVNYTLTLRVCRQGEADGWHLHAVLNLPTGMLVAEGSDETLMGTMDRALDSLWADLKRHLRQMAATHRTGTTPRRELVEPHPRLQREMMALATG